MTLVVVQKTPIGIVAIADTKLTPPEKSGVKVHPYVDAALKLHILNARTLWCFANSEYLAKCCLEKINHRWPDPDLVEFDDLSDFLFAFCKENVDVDFIIVDLVSSDLRKITKDEIIKNCEKAYIGSPEAYRYYSRAYIESLEINKKLINRDDVPEKALESMTMNTAFTQMIEKSGLASIGGPKIRLIQEGNSVFFPPELYASSGFPVVTKNGTVDFSNIEAGCFTITTLFIPTEKVNLLGFNFLTGDFGLIWRCGYDIKPFLIKDLSKKDIYEILKEIDSQLIRQLSK